MQRLLFIHNYSLCCVVMVKKGGWGGGGLVRASHHHVVSLDLRLLRRQFLALQFQTAAERREWWGVGW